MILRPEPPVLPFAPLLDHFTRTHRPNAATCAGQHDAGMTHLAAITGSARSHLYRLARRGLSWYQADRFAVALGVHPCEIWPEWLDTCPEVQPCDPPWPPVWPNEPAPSRAVFLALRDGWQVAA